MCFILIFKKNELKLITIVKPQVRIFQKKLKNYYIYYY